VAIFQDLTKIKLKVFLIINAIFLSKTFFNKSGLVVFDIGMRVTLSLKDPFTPSFVTSLWQFHKVPYTILYQLF